MPSTTLAHGISYPLPADLIKNPNVLSALSDWFKLVAVTSDVAIAAEGDRAEEAAKWMRSTLPNGTNLATFTKPGIFFVSSYANSRTMHDGDPLVPAIPDSYQAAAFFINIPGMSNLAMQIWVTMGSAGMQTTIKRRKFGSAYGAWKREEWEISGALLGSTDLDALDSGRYHVWTAGVAKSLGLPAGTNGGVLALDVITPTVKIMRYTPYNVDEDWKNRRGGGAWLGWKRTDLPAPPASNGTSGGSGSGYKTVPLALTLPSVGNSTTSITQRSERHPMSWNAPINRFRVHIRNGEYRIGQFATGAIPFTGLWFGPQGANPGDYASAPTLLHGAFTTPADGGEWVSRWFPYSLAAGAKYMLSYGFTVTAGQKFYYHVGNSFATNMAADASAVDGPPGSGLPLLDVWIEAETLAGTPVIGSLGDSISCGVGATSPVQDSWLNKYAFEKKALPVHYGGSSETLANSLDVNMEKWTRWSGMARPDALIMALGSNDIFTGATLATVQANMGNVIAAVRAYVSDSVHLGTITPRTGVTGAQEDVRRSFNAWAKTLPLGTRDVFDFSAAVSSDDETIIPEFDADGIHMTTAGYAAMSGAIARPVTAPPLVYAT